MKLEPCTIGGHAAEGYAVRGTTPGQPTITGTARLLGELEDIAPLAQAGTVTFEGMVHNGRGEPHRESAQVVLHTGMWPVVTFISS